MTLAVGIVDLAVQTAEQNKAKQINAIAVEVGALAGVIRDALEFCFSEAVKNTIAENARLEYIHIPARATCESCGHQFNSDERAAKCPNCDGAHYILTHPSSYFYLCWRVSASLFFLALAMRIPISSSSNHFDWHLLLP